MRTTERRHARQLGIVHPKQLGYPLTVIGVGSVGSTFVRVATQLGFRHLTLYDADAVVLENVGVQFYREQDCTDLKVRACARNLQFFLEGLKINQWPRAYTDEPLDGIVATGVDTIATRATIWKAVRRDADKIVLLVDGRTRGEEVQVYAVRPAFPDEAAWYESHLELVDPADALPCSEQGAPHALAVIAGLMVNVIVRWVRREPYPLLSVFNLRTMVMDTVGMKQL